MSFRKTLKLQHFYLLAFGCLMLIASQRANASGTAPPLTPVPNAYKPAPADSTPLIDSITIKASGTDGQGVDIDLSNPDNPKIKLGIGAKVAFRIPSTGAIVEVFGVQDIGVERTDNPLIPLRIQTLSQDWNGNNGSLKILNPEGEAPLQTYQSDVTPTRYQLSNTGRNNLILGVIVSDNGPTYYTDHQSQLQVMGGVSGEIADNFFGADPIASNLADTIETYMCARQVAVPGSCEGGDTGSETETTTTTGTTGTGTKADSDTDTNTDTDSDTDTATGGTTVTSTPTLPTGGSVPTSTPSSSASTVSPNLNISVSYE